MAASAPGGGALDSPSLALAGVVKMAKINSLRMANLCVLACIAVAAAGWLAAPGPVWAADPVVQARVTTVGMTNNLRFSPQSVTVRAGDAVVWQNTSGGTHTVTAEQVPAGAAAFNSGSLGPGAQFSHTFTVPGEYRYYCSPHRGMGMVGVVVVQR
jgi:plastocyanin